MHETCANTSYHYICPFCEMVQDTEALCVVAGERVWQLRVDVHILDHGGNLIDAAALAAIAALQHFRRPGVSHECKHTFTVALLFLCFF
jgi:exosome complex RNA-binding protein Rrp42 (RNase PH superfamily)